VVPPTCLQRVEGPLQSQRVVSVHAGWGHTLALCEGGAVYAWGYSAHGRLGFLSPDSRAAQHDAEAAAAAGSLAAGNVQARRFCIPELGPNFTFALG
jgi:alpha-tubulin suppressor-like RCC1 family protein